MSKVIRYPCNFPGCTQTYSTESDAAKCYNQGLVGTEVEPGLVLKAWHRDIADYLIVGKQGEPVNHWQTYHYFLLKEPPFASRNRKWRIKKAEDCPKNFLEIFHHESLGCLTQRESKKMQSMMESDPNSETMQRMLKENGIATLYSENPYKTQ